MSRCACQSRLILQRSGTEVSFKRTDMNEQEQLSIVQRLPQWYLDPDEEKVPRRGAALAQPRLTDLFCQVGWLNRLIAALWPHIRVASNR